MSIFTEGLDFLSPNGVVSIYWDNLDSLLTYLRIRAALIPRPLTMRCEVSKEQEELLLAMRYTAHQEAHKHLSDAGCEVFEMMYYTSRNSGLSIADAYVEATANASLSELDKDIIKAYLARRTLIEAFSEETVAEE